MWCEKHYFHPASLFRVGQRDSQRHRPLLVWCICTFTGRFVSKTRWLCVTCPGVPSGQFSGSEKQVSECPYQHWARHKSLQILITQTDSGCCQVAPKEKWCFQRATSKCCHGSQFLSCVWLNEFMACVMQYQLNYPSQSGQMVWKDSLEESADWRWHK